MEMEPLGVAEGQGLPTVRQQSVFIENRVGQLLRLTQILDETNARILALSVVYSVDCAICRVLVDDPDEAAQAFSANRFQVSEAELLVVGLPHGKRALLQTWKALLGGEVNIHYIYPLLLQIHGNGAMAVCPDNIEMAAAVLREKRITLLDQQDLLDARND